MKTCILLFILVAVAWAGVPKIIFDTDMNGDVDDVGALALLHALADRGEVEILACMTSHPGSAVCQCVDAINTWYHRPDLPIGAVRGGGDNGQYAQTIAKNFPNDITQADTPLPVDLYRQILASQTDRSVTIVTVGFLPNLAALLKSGADPYSELDGVALVEKKVKEWVCMGGVFPQGSEYNLTYMYADDAVYAIDNWPGRIIFTGWEIGKEIITGKQVHEFIPNSPVKKAYQLYNCSWAFDGVPYIAYVRGHYSWDPTAVLIAARGYEPYWDAVDVGYCHMNPDGTNEWRTDSDKDHLYVIPKMPERQVAQVIDELMNIPPVGAYIKKSSGAGWLPCTIELDASLTNPGFGRTVQEYRWNLGDGADATGETVAHDYLTAGVFAIELTAVDDQSASLTATDSVIVSDPIFGAHPFFGDARNYRRINDNLWTSRAHRGDLRYYLSNLARVAGRTWDGFSFLPDSVYSAFSFQADICSGMNLAEFKSADYKILFGYQDDQNYNLLQVRAGTSRVYAFRDGKRTVNGIVSSNLMADEQFHTLYLVNDGEQLVVYLDGEQVFSQKDADLLRPGLIAFGSDQYAVYFDNITISRTITGARSTPPVPNEFALHQNFPNPFNPTTTIAYELARDQFVTLTLHNLQGQQIAVLVHDFQTAGTHEVTLDASQLAGGVYFYRLSVASRENSAPQVLMRKTAVVK